MIATCHKIFRLRNLRQSFPGVGFNPYPQRCRTQHLFHREAVAGRSAGCGHARPPPFNGINLLNTSTMDADYITHTHGVLVRHATRRPPEWPSEPPPAAHTPGISSHTCVPLAIASADNFFRRLPPALGARRDEGELGEVCVTTTTWHAQPQVADARVSCG